MGLSHEFELGPDTTQYRPLGAAGVRRERIGGREVLLVEPGALTHLAATAFHDIAFFLRPAHNRQVAAILADPAASDNDRFVARSLLENAVISAQERLPFCQDTGTAIVLGAKGQGVLTEGDDSAALAAGVARTYATDYLRHSQVVASTLYEERNSGSNLPAQIEISAAPGAEYRFLFIAKGGGSANKTALFQQTRAILEPARLVPFLAEQIRNLGTAACPPYHLAIVIGGRSAEDCLATVKLASTGYLDGLPSSGDQHGRAFRDPALEAELLEQARASGIGAQFGGRHLAHDIRVVRLPRHGASLPIGLGVSCAADRQAKGLINADGLFLEELDREPGRWLAAREADSAAGLAPAQASAVSIDLSRPMAEVRAALSRHPVGTRLSLSGTLVVARDMAHARLKQRLDAGQDLPDWFVRHPVYYAGPARTPPGLPSGSFGPTTAGRMDSYVPLFQARGASLVMIAKGNRSPSVTESCQRHGGFYLGSVGGPAALLAARHITRVEVLDYAELGMEAAWRIEVKDFPAFIVVDDKGNDLYRPAARG